VVAAGEERAAAPAPVPRAPRVRASLEERIWGAYFDAARPKPCEKELREALAFLKAIDRPAFKARRRRGAARVALAVDCCGGHGLLGMLAVALGKAARAAVLDLHFPRSADSLRAAFTAASLLPPDPAAVSFTAGDVGETLPPLLAVTGASPPSY
jgi:hypothetical protein